MSDVGKQPSSPVYHWKPTTAPGAGIDAPFRRQISEWVTKYRPEFRTTKRSWFVMLALLAAGVGVFFHPALFFTLAVGAAATAWWRRESARQGILNTSFITLFAGLVLLLVSITLYVFASL